MSPQIQTAYDRFTGQRLGEVVREDAAHFTVKAMRRGKVRFELARKDRTELRAVAA